MVEFIGLILLISSIMALFKALLSGGNLFIIILVLSVIYGIYRFMNSNHYKK